MGINLRPVISSDCLKIWRWANDSQTRAASLNPEPIDWESHLSWFHKKLEDPNCLFLIAEESARPVGQIRFDLSGRDATISLSVDPMERGKGHGEAMVRTASAHLFSRAEIDIIHAYIKPDNRASRRIFERATYCAQKSTFIDGNEVLHFTLEQDFDHG